MIKLFIANLKQIVRNKTALFWSLVFPVIFIFIFGAFFGSGNGMGGSIGVVQQSTTELSKNLEKTIQDQDAFKVKSASSVDDLKDQIKKNKLAAGVVIPEGFGDPTSNQKEVTVYYDPGSIQARAGLEGFISNYLTQVNYQALGIQPIFGMNEEKANSQASFGYFEFVLIGIIGMALMNSAVQGMAVTITKYRDDQILKRITTTPLKTWKFIAAEVAANLVENAVQVGLILGIGIWFFKADVPGSMLGLVLLALVGAVLFQLVGFCVAAFSKNTTAAEGMATAITVPMMFLSGVFFANDQLPKWLYAAVQFLPLSPLLQMLRTVGLNTGSLLDVPSNIYIVIGWIVALLGLAIWRFRLVEE